MQQGMDEPSLAPSIDELSRYLSYGGWKGSMEIDSKTGRWEGRILPWYRPTCLAVLFYVIKFHSNFHQEDTLSDTIRRLNESASKYSAAQWQLAGDYDSPGRWVWEDTVEEMDQLIAETFVNSFMPEVQRFFNVPKPHHLSDKDKSLKLNEILAGFLDFLLQILNAEANTYLVWQYNFGLLRKDLTFLLTFLGDTPFSCSELQVTNILEEYVTLANEAGNFIYSFIFATRPIMVRQFNSAKDALLEKVELLNAMIKDYCIKEYCIKFSQLPRFGVERQKFVDSLYIVDSVLDDLKKLMSRDLMIIDEVKHQIRSLHDELMFSKSLLKDIEVPQETLMQETRKSRFLIIDAAYEAEYLVNSYVVGNIPVWYLDLRLPVVIEKIKVAGTSIKKIYHIKMIKDVGTSVEKIYGIKALQVDKDFSARELVGNLVVGFEDNRRKILNYLGEGSRERQIISIHGMPGLGKTTIAKKLYNDSSIYHRFDRRAWCVISQTYQKRKALIDILLSVASERDTYSISEMEDHELGLEIHKSLIGRRYLIIMDDVWNSKTWDDLGRYFPDDKNGSRILLTSRIKDTAPANSIFYPLPILSEVQCWDLLEHNVFSMESGVCPPQLLDIGKAIAMKCQGLPLAVVVIAGILANMEKEQSVWKQVEKNIDSYMFDDPNGFSKILELSYEHLPDHLRPCFLYFASFQEDAEISTRKLIWLWIAEGFVHNEKDESLEDVAESYLYDLINRSLVVIAKRRSCGDGIKTCYIHDLLHDLCIKKAREENFLLSIDENSSFYQKHGRMWIRGRSSTYGTTFGLHCRSLSGHFSNPSSCFPQMALLRVMALYESWGGHNLKRIESLAHLRYLVVDEIPETITGELFNLEVLCLQSDSIVFHIPSSIQKMVNLRHVRTKSLSRVQQDFDSSITNNLKSLSFIYVTDEKDEGILRCSPHLEKLKCQYYETLFPNLGYFSKIKLFKIVFENPFKGELTKIDFPSTLEKLTLSGIGLPWENMSIVGKLPNLRVLKIEKKAFIGDEWETNDDEFQELRFLKIDDVDLMQWTTCIEHFPKLECLVMNLCWKLMEVPNELGDVTTLQRVEMRFCGFKASLSAVKIEQEQHKDGNEELMVIITNRQWSKQQLLQKWRESQEQQDNENEE